MVSSFGRKLKREVLGSPKKAAALGLLCLVAIYYWAPLLSGWLKGADVAVTEAPASESTPQQASSGAVTTAAAPASTYSCSWKQVAECLDNSQQQAAPLASIARDPFQTIKRAMMQPDVVEAEAPAQAVAPQDVGLVLSSTMVGRRQSVALIGGAAYRVGDEVPGAADGEITFLLKSIHPRHIVLQRAGRQFELSLKEPELVTAYLDSQSTTNPPDAEPVDE
jgi:hypothetical protein